jgi:hypothetical protein
MGACFTIHYLGAVTVNNVTTLSFKITNTCPDDLRTASFELPASVDPNDVTDEQTVNPNFTYTVDVGVTEPFFSIRFLALDTAGYRDGAFDIFAYTLPTADFDTMSTLLVSMSTSMLTQDAVFDARDC